MADSLFDPLEYWESLEPYRTGEQNYHVGTDGILRKGAELTPDYLPGDIIISTTNGTHFLRDTTQRVHSIEHGFCNLIIVGADGGSPFLLYHAMPIDRCRTYPFGMSKAEQLSELSSGCYWATCYALQLLACGEKPWIASYHRSSEASQLATYLQLIGRGICMEAVLKAGINLQLMDQVSQIAIDVPDHADTYNALITRDKDSIHVQVKQFEAGNLLWENTRHHSLRDGSLVNES